MINYKGPSSLYSPTFAMNGNSMSIIGNGNNNSAIGSIAKTSSSELEDSQESHSDDQESTSELDEINWSHFLLPITYMADNWPLKVNAVKYV